MYVWQNCSFSTRSVAEVGLASLSSKIPQLPTADFKLGKVRPDPAAFTTSFSWTRTPSWRTCFTTCQPAEADAGYSSPLGSRRRNGQRNENTEVFTELTRAMILSLVHEDFFAERTRRLGGRSISSSELSEWDDDGVVVGLVSEDEIFFLVLRFLRRTWRGQKAR